MLVASIAMHTLLTSMPGSGTAAMPACFVFLNHGSIVIKHAGECLGTCHTHNTVLIAIDQ